MERTYEATYRLTIALLDAALIVITWLGVTVARHVVGQLWSLDLIPGDPVLRPLALGYNVAALVLVLPVWLYALHRGHTYDDLRRVRLDIMLLKIARASAFALLFLIGITFALRVGDQLSRTVLAGFAACVVLTVHGGRVVLIHSMRRKLNDSPSYQLLVVGALSDVGPLLDVFSRHKDWGIRLLGVVETSEPSPDGVHRQLSGVRLLGSLQDLPRVLETHAVDEVMVTGASLSVANLRQVADSCEEVGVRFSMDANFLGLSISRAQLTDFDGWHVLSFSATPEDAEALAVKRAMDIALSGLALVILAPVYLATAALIKLEDRGPVFFAQERSGLFGRTFNMWKFRSMVVDAEAQQEHLQRLNEMDGPVFKMKRDPRITRIGAIIRKTSIDELPQFWNVFRGEMSLVGPRPPLPPEVENYQRWQRRRLSMKPGITCIWQVSGRNEIDFETWMKLDLQYIDNWSLFLDMKLLARTLPVVLLGTGAS